MPGNTFLSSYRRTDSHRDDAPREGRRDRDSGEACASSRSGPRFRWITGVALAGLTAFAGQAAAEIQDIAAIRDAAKSFVAAQIPPTPGTSRTIEVDNLDPRLRLHACDQELEAFFPPGVRGGASRTVGVRCRGTKPWTVYVTAHISYQGDVLVAARGLPRGTVIEPSDLTVQERDLQGGPLGYLTQAKQAVGMRTTRPLRPGALIEQDSVEQVPVVSRGQRVWLVAESSSLQVRTIGTALQDGAIGELVKVENTSSGKVVWGVVARQGVVRISL
jgi:flagella basal body P-ring formation protein FlgA